MTMNVDNINSKKDIINLNKIELEELQQEAYSLKEMYDEKYEFISKELFERYKI